MTLYPQVVANEASWPQPIEMVYQLLGGGDASTIAPKLPHLGMADILFMGSIMVLPRERRPWGIVTWLSEVFQLSRPALYSLSNRVVSRLSQESVLALADGQAVTDRLLDVTDARLKRTVLTAAFPGKIALRPLQQLLDEAFDETRSIGWISELLAEAGERAGQVLKRVDYSGIGPLLVLRDETFFQEHPILFIVDPVSSTILQAVVAPDRQADTWGIALLTAQAQGLEIAGVVEDMARMYPKSLSEAEIEVPVQKDLWHIQRDGSQLCLDLERAAFRATKRVMALEKKLSKAWSDELFIQYVAAVASEEKRYAQQAAFVTWFDHLCDSLEIIDLPSGAIRDKATNQWLLEESLRVLESIENERVQQWLRTLRRHQDQLLTWMDWLEPALDAFQTQLAQVLDHPLAQSQFMRLVAKEWRLRQAVINGHRHLRTAAAKTTALLHSVLADMQPLVALAQRLSHLLDAACRTSSLVENLNGLLKQFLHNRRAFPSAAHLQNYLNLFTLWQNMRVFQRGKRQGMSPFQRAGIRMESDDWLTLLGYHPA
jgi:hypothetical protein